MEHSGGALFHIGSFEVTSVMVTMLGISVALCVLAFISTRNMKMRPGKAQNIAEKIIEMLLSFLAGVVGPEKARIYLPYMGTLFVFILVSNYSGMLPLAGTLPGLAAPTSSLSVTMALAICTFLITHYIGVRRHGFGYVKHFTKPMIFMFPLLILEELIRPLSLTLRLYGNVYGEETVTHEIFNLVPLLVPLALNALSLLLGFVQAMAFVLLSCSYINGAASEEH